MNKATEDLIKQFPELRAAVENKENKEIYCRLCDEVTTHVYKGTQEGIPGKHLDIYDCLQCKDTCGRWRDDEDPRVWSDEDMGLIGRLG